MRDERQELDALLADQKRSAKDKRNVMEDTQKELDNLESQQGLRFVQLRSVDAEVATAWEWLQDNASIFEKPVFGPAMLTCSIKDKRYSDQVQSLLQRDDFLCFTAQTKNDHKTLTNKFYQELKLAVTVRTITADLSSFRSPISPENLRAMGLDGCALDFVEGPDPVLAMLCSEKRIHLTGVALKDVSEEQYQRISDGEAINSFATGNTMYRITRRREYGPGATSTLSRTIQSGRYWKDEPLDTAAKAELEQRLEQAKREFVELKKQNEDWKEKSEALKLKTEQISEEVVSGPFLLQGSPPANATHRRGWSRPKTPCNENIINGKTCLTRLVRGNRCSSGWNIY